jgi:uncharacterized membrane protein
MKEWAEVIARHVSNAVEVVAALIIGVSLLVVIYKYISSLFIRPSKYTNQSIRIQFGGTVAVALELLLGADVLSTAVAPTWNDIGKLAAIAVLRTALNYFLEKELENSRRTGTSTKTQEQS